MTTPAPTPKTARIDIVYPEPLIARIEYLAETNDESRSTVMHRAMALGLTLLEEELGKHLSFQNQLRVAEKLKRRGTAWEESLARLDAGTDEMQAIAKELRRSAGGE